jgi:hypothetical protein
MASPASNTRIFAKDEYTGRAQTDRSYLVLRSDGPVKADRVDERLSALPHWNVWVRCDGVCHDGDAGEHCFLLSAEDWGVAS